jgi:Sigma-70 region 3
MLPGVGSLRAELRTIVDTLLRKSVATREVSLDALGEAIGSRAVSYTEIDAMVASLEAKGRRVVGATDLRGEEQLRTVVATAKSLSTELGRRPNIAEISARAGLSLNQVKHALVLARVMQR